MKQSTPFKKSEGFKPFFLAFLIIVCSGINSIASNFNWTGAALDGDWFNTLNWDVGGSTPFSPPSALDDVYIVEGTFFTGPTDVDIDGSAQCRNLTISVPSGSNFTSTSTSDLSIYGEYTGDADFTNTSFLGIVYFRSIVNVNQHITMNNSFFNRDVVFDSPTGIWTMQDDFECKRTVTLVRGTLSFGGGNHTITMDRFSSDNTNLRSLDISNTYININGGLDVNGLKSWDLERTSGLSWLNNAAGSEIHMNADIAQNVRATSFASEGLDYDKVFFHNIVTTANLYGDNIAFKELVFEGSARILGDLISSDDVSMAGGKTYTITESHTLTINLKWDITGDCKNYTTLTSSLSGTGKEATVDFLGNLVDLTASYLIIENVPLATATFTGGNIINMTASAGWPLLTASGIKYYWHGGAGNWSDPMRWSINPSGPHSNPGSCIPGPLDSVYFNANSGLGIGLAANVDVTNAYCHYMDWTGVPANAEFTASSTSNYARNKLNIYGSMILATGMDYQYDGTINCKYDNSIAVPYISQIDLKTQSLIAPMFIEGQNGDWQLQSAFNSTSVLYIYAGAFRTMNNNMDVKRLNSKVRNKRTIDLGSSTINVTGTWSVHLRTNPASVDSDLNLIEGMSTIRMINFGFNEIWDWGETYYNVELVNPNATAILYGANTFKNDLSFYGNGSFSSANTIEGTLLFSKGKSYNINNTQTFGPSGTLDANGDCNNYIAINNGAFSKASGTISANWAVIQDNDGTGGATYSTSNSILSGTTGWTNGITNTDDYHFQATTSMNWGDPNNWYKTYTSGVFSNPAGCIPGPGNDVFFYKESFDVTYPDLLMDELNAYCHTMTWVAGAYTTTPIVTSTSTNNKLNIYGSLLLQGTSSMDWQFDGTVDFKTPDLTPHSITSNGQIFLRDVIFNGAVDAEWHLTDDFETALTQINSFVGPMLKVFQGKFFSDTRTITAGGFRSEGGSTRTVDLTDSPIYLTTKTAGGISLAWKTTSSGVSQPLTLVMTGSELHLNNINSGGNAQLTAIEADFHDVYFDNTGLGTISGGDNEFHLADFTGNGAIFGNNDFHILHFSPGGTYDLEVGKTQKLVTENTVPGLFDATGTNGAGLINIVSTIPATQAFIEQVDGSICIDFCNITDISVSQPGAGSLAFAGANSNNIANNSGWSFDDCVTPILTGCVEEAVNFNTLVNGTSFDWTFGDGQTGVGTPITHTYSTAGTYNVFVVIGTFSQGVSSEDGRNFIVEISESCCKAGDDPNYVNKSGTITGYENWPDKVFVTADVFVTGTGELDITNSDVVFADGTGIHFKDNSKLSATNSTFRACTNSDIWTGLHFDKNAGGKVTESIFINAQNAITASTDGVVESVNNQFLNNQAAIVIEPELQAAVGHVINGNTVTVNKDNPFTDGITAVDFNGIIVNSVLVESTISQNEFVYTSSVSTIDRVYGIQNTTGAITASDNTFTNLTFAYVQVEAVAASSFENNVVDYNSEALNLYSSIADLVAVTIDGTTAPTLIATNEINLSYNVTNSSKGIYVSNSTAVVIHENEIDGFTDGIQGLGVSGLINSNEIGHCNNGISIANTTDLGIQDNKVNFSAEFGIYISNSFNTIRVWRNTVKNDPDVSGSIGIKYFMNSPTQPTGVEFIDNCVFDTQTALDFTNASSDQCITIPFIRGNYLFSYTSYGLFVQEFIGFVGTGGSDPGRNSFLSNNGAVASDIYYNGACGQLFLVDNWPSVLTAAGPSAGMVVIQFPGGARHSQSTCGNQDIPEIRLKLMPVMADYLSDQYPLELIAGNYHLSDDFMTAIQETEATSRLDHMKLLSSVLAYNDQKDELNILLDHGDQLLEQNEAKWLRAITAVQLGEWKEARKYSSSIHALPHNIDFVEIQGLRLNYMEQGLSWAELHDADRIRLLQIEDKGGKAKVLARNLVHIVEGGRPYQYTILDKHQSQALAGSSRRSSADNELIVYPNPASNKLQIEYALEGPEMQLIVYDVFGKMVADNRLVGGLNRITMDVSEWSSGIYLIKIENAGELVTTRRIVVE